MSKSSIGGCDPLAPPDGGFIQPIRAQLSEMGSSPDALTPEDYRGLAVSLISTLNAATSTDKQTYRVPNTHNFVIDTIVGVLALTDIFNEVLVIKNGVDATKGIGDFTTAPDVRDRLLMKAMNCRMSLSNSDRNQAMFDNGKLNLSSILTQVGGRPIDWSAAPHIIPAGETIEMDIELIQAVTGDGTKLVGGDTLYGLVLIGKLIRVKRS